MKKKYSIWYKLIMFVLLPIFALGLALRFTLANPNIGYYIELGSIGIMFVLTLIDKLTTKEEHNQNPNNDMKK